MLTEKQGSELVRLARLSIVSYFSDDNLVLSERPFLNRKSGVFVTLKNHGKLRGCIGFPEPAMRLGEAVVRAARAAAFEDPRFPPVGENEEFDIEISVLTEPEEIDVPKSKVTGEITVGEDGLIVRGASASGLLLPQVATEQGWGADEFLAQASMKAGLPPDAWLHPGVKVFKFQCQVFHER
jgi:uncharacterized protein (TIGR00296 family)